MADFVSMGSKGLRELSVDVQRAADGLYVETTDALLSSAEDAAARAREIALGYSSSSVGAQRTGAREDVANSINVVPKGRRTVRVEAGGPGIPLAGLWELGNRDSRPEDDSFSHPVFQREGKTVTTVSQSKNRFLSRAFDELEPETFGRFQALLRRILDRSRL